MKESQLLTLPKGIRVEFKGGEYIRHFYLGLG